MIEVMLTRAKTLVGRGRFEDTIRQVTVLIVFIDDIMQPHRGTEIDRHIPTSKA